MSESDWKNTMNWPHKVLQVDLFYPRNSPCDTIQVGLCDVRAADDVQVSYDFARDGWVIKQASKWEWDIDDDVCGADWQEVAFIKAWARDPNRQK
jgi:hypothetical protein